MYVTYKFVSYYWMATSGEIGNIKEMALPQKFELFIFQHESLNIYSSHWKIHPKTKYLADDWDKSWMYSHEEW